VKSALSSATLVAMLAVVPASFAGPAPGQPGLGERVAEVSRSRPTSTSSYALTGGHGRERGRSARADGIRHKRNGPVNLAHRRMPGESR
jgi:hypothetical protein